MKVKIIVIVLLFSAAFFLAAESAEEIIRRIDEQQAVESSKSELSMLIYPNAEDKENVREFRVLSYGRGDEESYMEFLSPRSIKGLKLLSRGDDQWVYFASTGRRRKIATSSRSKKQSVRGVGGDFSYEDLGGGKMEEKYSFKILKSGKKEWVLEGKAMKEDSVYSRIVLYVDKDRYLPTKIEYYTEEEGHYKDLTMDEIKDMGGREMATRMTMFNHDRGSKTVVVIHESEYDLPIDEKYFNPNRFYK